MLKRGYVIRFCLGVVLMALGFVTSFYGMDQKVWLMFYSGTIVSWLGIAYWTYNEMRRITEGVPGAKNVPE